MIYGEQPAHINTFGAYNLFTDVTDTVGNKFFLTARESLYSGIRAKVKAIG